LKNRFNLQKAQALLVYALLQVPGFLFLGIILLFALDRGWIAAGTAWVVILAWIVKDTLFYRFYKKALSPSPQNVVARLHGARAVVMVPLEPEGQVALKGEIWRAVSLDGNISEPGAQVLVEGNKGLTLEVRRE
jgi:membrane protein implicated in regulation of membrane protease activity